MNVFIGTNTRPDTYIRVGLKTLMDAYEVRRTFSRTEREAQTRRSDTPYKETAYGYFAYSVKLERAR